MSGTGALQVPSSVPISRNSSSGSLLDEEDEDVTLYHPVHSPCSPSILLNPLHGSPSSSGSPPLRPQPPAATPPLASTSGSSVSGAGAGAAARRPSIQAQMVSVEATPPAHWAAENAYSPPRGEGRYSRSNSASRAVELDQQQHDPRQGASLISSVSEGGEFGNNRLKFAPLPAGRRAYRSNSLSLGVAARARMISGQGGAPNVHQARYAGPQQWYQPGAPHPDDVYTYKDVQKFAGKLWGKVAKRGRRASSASDAGSATSDTGSRTSSNDQEAREMESSAKGKSKEIEHIEEVHEEDEDEMEDEESRGRSGAPDGLAMVMGDLQLRDQQDDSSVSDGSGSALSDVPPQTPEDSHSALPPLSAKADKGKGVDPRERQRLV